MTRPSLYCCAAILIAASIVTLPGCSSDRGNLIRREADAHRRHVAAVRLIQSHGGTVRTNDQGAVVTIQRTDKKATRESFEALIDVKNLASLYLSSVDVDGLDLEDLEALVTLRSITMTDVPLDDSDIATLIQQWRLRGVHLYKTGLTDPQLAQIAMLPGLRDVTLGYADITDSGLAALKAAPGLRSVRLVKTPVSLLAAQGLCDANDWLVVELDETRLRGYRAAE